jgi:phosphoribosylformylglycinamidine (FGAM) synthase-like enzyme
MYSQIYIESISKFQSNSVFLNKKGEKVTFFQSEIYNILIKNDKNEEILSFLKEIFKDDLNNNQYFFYQAEKKDLKTCYESLNHFEHNLWRNFEYCVDIYLMDGQTDNVAHTILSLIKEICERKLNIEFSYDDYKISYIRRFYFSVDGLDVEKDKVLDDELKLHFSINKIVHNIILRNLDILHNLENQTFIYKDELVHDSKNKRKILNEEYNLQKMTEAEFFKLNNNLQLGLTYEDVKVIREFYIAKKDGVVTRIELETIGQSWSEHCKHRIFAAKLDDIEDGLYRHYIKRATKEIQQKHIEKYGKDLCYSVFTDNAGAIEFNENYLVTHKVETHNSPSALDPFGGAITGVLGVNRDCLGFGLGAKPIMNTFGFCFAKPSSEVNFSRQPDMKAPQLSSNYIIDGVVKGVEAAGNQSGIPTTHGVVFFNDSYCAKPLVFVGTVGLIPKKINGKKSWIKKPENGDQIVILGGRTGKDGIHGAIFSSDSIDENSNITHVQIGDPITQKKMLDAILEMRDLGLYNAITDNGAGGFSSSIGEMGERGFKVDLRKALLKAKDMQPFEIWVSESQERMTLAVPTKNMNKLVEIVKKHDVEYQILGEFNNSGEGEIIFADDSSAEKSIKLNMEFLHEGNPQYILKSEKPEFRELSQDEIEDILNNGESAKYLRSVDKIGVLSENHKNEIDKNHEQKKLDLKTQILAMMARQNISTREELFTKFDHTVQGGSIVQPINDNVCADAGVTKPILSNCPSGVAISSYMNPNYGGDSEDTYNMVACSIDAAIRNLIVVGASPNKIALLDNFCWSSSLEGKRLWQLKRACQACYEVAVNFGTPFISGKDSMFNDFKGFDKENNPVKLSALPTLLISSIGIVEDTTMCVTNNFKNKGDLIYIIGDSKPELGGSEYFDMIGYNGGFVPELDVEKSIQTYKIFHELLKNYLIESAISIHNGGLANALNRSGMNCGAKINLDDMKHSCRNIEQILFSESCGRILFSISPSNSKIVEDFFEKCNFSSWSRIGEMNDDGIFSINYKNNVVVYSMEDVKSSYKRNYFKV